MHRGFTTNLSLAGMLLFLLTTLSSLYFSEDAGVVTFYNEKGDTLYSDITTTASKSFVIKTSKIIDSIYSALDKDTSAGIAQINGISPSKAREVERYIRLGYITDTLVVNNIIEIFDKSVFIRMRAIIRDTEKGGTDTLNNKEYGGMLFADGEIFLRDSGSYVPLCVNGQLAVRLPSRGVAEFHDHPSGCMGKLYPWPCPDTVLAKRAIKCGHAQGPSLVDQQRVERRKGYVFGMRARIVFVYDSTGIRATVPFRFFERD
jgi:hypothetical protein